MKPLNNDNPACNPISSNCVIWQGPDIECIKLCKGDTVSDVVFKLATELCTVMTELNVSSYDLSCFNLVACAPKDFTELLQFILDRLCKVETCSGCVPDCNGVSNPPSISSLSGCPNCEVSIAPCFYFQNQFGDTVTTMQLVDYVHAIGNKVCDLVSQISTINATLVTINTRLTVLENTPPIVYPIPQITPVCVLPSIPTDINVVLSAVESQFCLLEGATGLPTNIYTAITYQCPGLESAPVLGPGGGTMGSLSGWRNPVVNLSDSITNMWLTICDMRAAIQNIQINCCPGGCDGIVLNLQAVVVDGGNNLNVFITGSIPAGFIQCDPLGTLFTISDALGGSFTIYLDVITGLNNPAGILVSLVSTPVNPASNITVSTTVCLSNATTNATCSTSLSYLVNNEAACPALEITFTDTTINYSAVIASISGIYTVQLYNNAGTVLLAQNIHTVTAPSSFASSFTGLSAGTPYKVRVLVTIGASTTTCPFVPVVTNPAICPPPSGVSAEIVVI
jgi:hypothetical protein